MKREPRVVTDNFIEIERKFLISDINPLMLPDHRETVIEETFLLSINEDIPAGDEVAADGGKLEFPYPEWWKSRAILDTDFGFHACGFRKNGL